MTIDMNIGAMDIGTVPGAPAGNGRAIWLFSLLRNKTSAPYPTSKNIKPQIIIAEAMNIVPEE